MQILFGGFRDWALRVHADLAKDWPMELVSSPAAFEQMVAEHRYDVIILAGWSWIVSKSIVEAMEVVGIHPSDLPRYAGGSPIQNQILDGVRNSAVTLFRLTPTLDLGPIIYKEPICLEGHLAQVFDEIERASVMVLRRYLSNWPNVPSVSQPAEDLISRRRLKPAASRLTTQALATLTCRELWDFIRCREDPYPNAFLEDETGRLIIRWVEFEPARPAGSSVRVRLSRLHASVNRFCRLLQENP
jgi:methionyl-tRNA formyltransferase